MIAARHAAPEIAPRSVEDVTAENVRTIDELERAAQLEESLGDRVAKWISRVCGSIAFL